MSIPDVQILQNYVLTLDCGHKRRTMAPCVVGKTLPCLAPEHSMEPHVVVGIEDKQGRSVERVGWLDPRAALLGAYDELREDAEALPWYRWMKRRQLRRDAGAVGLAGALYGPRRR